MVRFKQEPEDYVDRDIQEKLIEATRGLTTRNIYSQFAAFICRCATHEDNERTEIAELALFLGLLSDSIFGQFALGITSQYKNEPPTSQDIPIITKQYKEMFKKISEGE